MNYDHEAIYKAYTGTDLCIEDGVGVFDKDHNFITLDQAKIDAARTTINSELAATKYQRDRAAEYPSIEDQLDNIYHNGIDVWKATIKTIKDKYPKP